MPLFLRLYNRAAEVNHIILVCLFGDFTEQHFTVKVFVKLRITLLIMADCALPQISLLAVKDILVAFLLKGDRNLTNH